MSNELSILALSGLWTMAVILVQVTAALSKVSLPQLASPRDDMPALDGIAGRLDRAQLNSIYALALFAPAVLLVHVAEVTSANTLLAAQVFLIARIAYVPIYAFGIPWLRTPVWVAGFLATASLYMAAL